MPHTFDLQDDLTAKRALIERALDEYLPAAEDFPPLIHAAMRYSAQAGGKRLRPLLLLMTAELCGGDSVDVLFAAAAIEMIHTYSLIHDDLPAMDNDDLRRGRPTNHKVYGEDIAILAGDALLTLAFQVLTEPQHAERHAPSALLRAVYELAAAAGSHGMVGGQVLDMQAEQRAISPAELAQIHQLKTGRLITVAMRLGAILTNASKAQLEAVTRYGDHVGLAFQIVDDILDLEGDVAVIGKPLRSDEQNQKATYPALYGLAHSKTLAHTLLEQAKDALRDFGMAANALCQLADWLGARTH